MITCVTATSLFAALDTRTGKVLVVATNGTGPWSSANSSIPEAEVPADLDVHLFADNYATHKTALIRNRLPSGPASICTSHPPAPRG